MSAFMCSSATFDYLAAYAVARRVRFGGLSCNTAQDWGETLHAANCTSVETRYPSCKDTNDMGTKNTYTVQAVRVPLEPVRVLAAARCVRYQSCEYGDWENSPANAMLQAIEAEAIREITDGQPWDLDEEHVRPTRTQEAAQRAAQILAMKAQVLDMVATIERVETRRPSMQSLQADTTARRATFALVR